MDNIENNYEDLCRTCLKLLLNKTKSRRSYNIFSESQEFLDKFLACTRLFAETNDGLPEKICVDCHDKICDFFDFQELCKASEKKLCEVKFSKNPPPSSRALWQHFNAEDEAPIYDWQIQTEGNQVEVLDISQVGKSDEDAIPKEEPEDIVEEEHKNSTDEDNLDLEHGDFEESEDSDAEFLSGSDSSEDDEQQEPTVSKNKKHKSNRDSDNKKNKVIPKKESFKDRNPLHMLFYHCDLCPRRFVIEHKLIAHKRVHEGLVAYPCTYPGCKRGFKHQSSLDIHLKQHEGSNVRFKCQESGCGKSYIHKLSLRWHMRKFHNQGPQIKKHCCETCGKCYGTAVALGEHMYTHGDKSEYPFACNYENCTQRFIQKDKFNIHMMRHAGIKNYVCPHCGMRKTTNEELTIHINSHTREKTYPCELCSKDFINPSILNNHIRVVHKGIKNFICRFCGQSFSTSKSCEYHENIHTGATPYECSICKRRYAQPSSLRAHEKKCLSQGNKKLKNYVEEEIF